MLSSANRSEIRTIPSFEHVSPVVCKFSGLAARPSWLILWPMSKSTNILLLILLVFASVLVGIADYIVVNITARQFLARNFATVRGRIVYSQVTQRKILRGG